MARFPQRHPLLAWLLLLALMPAIIGGSLTHACGCEGLIYVGGCRCYGDADHSAAAETAVDDSACAGSVGDGARQAAEGSCRSGCCGASAPSPQPDTPPDAPAQPLDAANSVPTTIGLPTHHCDHLGYEMDSAMPRFVLPAQPVALLPAAMAPDLRPHHSVPNTALDPLEPQEPPLIPLRCEAHLLPLRL